MTLTEMQRGQAVGRFAMIRPYIEDGVCQREIARVHQLSLRTVQRWIQAYREEGLAGLFPKARSDGGHCRGLPEDLVQLIEGLALQAVRRPLTSIHALVSDVADEQGWPRPSYGQVYRIVQRVPKDLLTLGRDGAATYRETFDLLYRREARHANEIWQADHCLVRGYFLNEQGKAQMPWLTVIEDEYSRDIAGYRLSWSAPSAAMTALTLRDAMSMKEDPHWPMYGVPECFYTDHGSDFTSKHLEAVAVDLKIELVFSHIGQPRGRGKGERFFRTVREEVVATLPGYAPKVEGDLRRQREIAVEARKEACLTLGEFDKIFRAWVVETYGTRIHTETHAAPHARWLSSGVIPVLPGTQTQVDLLLVQPRRRRVVHQEGITLLGGWYMHELLAGYVKEAVIIRYDPMYLATIRVYTGDKEERFLCEASCVERGGQAVSLQEIVKERTKRRKAVGKTLRERKGVVERYASPQQRAKRALEKVPAAVGPGEVKSQVGGSAHEDESVTECVTEVSEWSKKQSKKRKIRWYDDEEEE